jgi:hypothetical protein
LTRIKIRTEQKQGDPSSSNCFSCRIRYDHLGISLLFDSISTIKINIPVIVFRSNTNGEKEIAPTVLNTETENGRGANQKCCKGRYEGQAVINSRLSLVKDVEDGGRE